VVGEMVQDLGAPEKVVEGGLAWGMDCQVPQVEISHDQVGGLPAVSEDQGPSGGQSRVAETGLWAQ
jgi:hypothetical protein